MSNDKQCISADAMGIEVSWSFGYGSADDVQMPRELLERTCSRHGFAGVSQEPLTPIKALKRAVQLAPKRESHAIKQLARPNKDTPAAMGVYMRNAQEGEGGDEWTMGARVRVAGDELVALPPEGEQHMHTGAEAIATDLAHTGNALINTAFNVDISVALVDIGNRCGWINRRRNSGGVYYLQSGSKAEQFVQLLRTLGAHTASLHPSHQFIPEIVEVFPRPLSQATISDAAGHHFETKIDSLLKQLKQAADDGKMRSGTMEKRADEIDALMKQAADFQALLDDAGADIKARLRQLKRVFTTGIQSGVEALGEAFAFVDGVPQQAVPVSEPAPEPTPVVEAPEPTSTDAIFGDI